METLIDRLIFVCRCALADLKGLSEYAYEDHPCFETIEDLEKIIAEVEEV